jgi:hypothetical protein
VSSEITAPAYAQMGRACCGDLPAVLYAQFVDLGTTYTPPGGGFDCSGSCYNDVKAWNGGSDVIALGRTTTFLPGSPFMWSGPFQGSCSPSRYQLTNLVLRCTDNPNFPYTRRFSLTSWSDFDQSDQVVYAPDPTSTDVPFLLIFPSVQAGGLSTPAVCTFGVRITDTHP